MLSENVTMIPRYSIARQRIAQFTLEDHNGPVLPLHPYRNVDQTLGCCPLSPLWKMTGRAELRHDWVFHCRYNTPNTPQTLNINPLPSLYPLPSLLNPLSSPFSSLLMWTTFCFPPDCCSANSPRGRDVTSGSSLLAGSIFRRTFFLIIHTFLHEKDNGNEKFREYNNF